MSTTKTSNDGKKAGGYLKEKFTIGLTRVTGDEVERAIMKVSSHMLKSPNDKHLQRLIQATHGHIEGGKKNRNVNAYIIEELEKRSHTHNWVVVLKTMITLHTLMQEGSLEVNKIMQNNRTLFSFRSIKDVADSPDGAAQKNFIMHYIRYLEERNITQARVDVDVRIESEEYLTVLKSLPLDALAQIMTQLIQQLECIGEVEFREVSCDNFATLEAYCKLISDGRRLYLLLSNRMVYVLERFEDMDLGDKQVYLLIYRRYAKCVHKVAQLFDTLAAANRHFGVEIPKLKEFPETLMKKLEDEVECSAISKECIEELPADLSCATGSNNNGVGAPSGTTLVPPPSTTSHAAATTEAPVTSSVATTETTATEAAVVPPPKKNNDLDDLFGPTAASSNNTNNYNNNYNSNTNTASAGQQPDLFGVWGNSSDTNPQSQPTTMTAAADPSSALDAHFIPMDDSPKRPKPANTNNSNPNKNAFEFDPFGESKPAAPVFGGSNYNTTTAATSSTSRPHNDMDDLFGPPPGNSSSTAKPDGRAW